MSPKPPNGKLPARVREFCPHQRVFEAGDEGTRIAQTIEFFGLGVVLGIVHLVVRTDGDEAGLGNVDVELGGGAEGVWTEGFAADCYCDGSGVSEW